MGNASCSVSVSRRTSPDLGSGAGTVSGYVPGLTGAPSFRGSDSVEYASQRKIESQQALSPIDHWPIWILVFLIAPGPLTSTCPSAFSIAEALWLGAVLVGTAIAGLNGKLPGVEPRPYVIRFTEDRPNPLYRRICYTFAWSEVITLRY